jgi:DHA2 family multidrug resistance protein-like MFS transporter
VTSTYAGGLGGAVSGLSGTDRAVAESGLVGAFNVAQGLGADGGTLVEAAKQAFVDGIGVAAVAGAVTVALAAIAAHRLLPRHAPIPTPEGERLVVAEELALVD